LVLLVSCFVAKKTMDEVNTKIIINTENMDKLTAESARISRVSNDDEINKAIFDIAQAIRSSDPVSNAETVILENELSEALSQLEKYALACDKEGVNAYCKQIQLTLDKRNTNCRLYKANRF